MAAIVGAIDRNSGGLLPVILGEGPSTTLPASRPLVGRAPRGSSKALVGRTLSAASPLLASQRAPWCQPASPLLASQQAPRCQPASPLLAGGGSYLFLKVASSASGKGPPHFQEPIRNESPDPRETLRKKRSPPRTHQKRVSGPRGPTTTTATTATTLRPRQITNRTADTTKHDHIHTPAPTT